MTGIVTKEQAGKYIQLSRGLRWRDKDKKRHDSKIPESVASGLLLPNGALAPPPEPAGYVYVDFKEGDVVDVPSLLEARAIEPIPPKSKPQKRKAANGKD